MECVSSGEKKKSLTFQKVPFCQYCFCSQRGAVRQFKLKLASYSNLSIRTWMKPSWKHSQYYTFTQSFPTAGLICVTLIPAPSEKLDDFSLCSSMHRNEEQVKSREVSGLPKSPSPGSRPQSVPAGDLAQVGLSRCWDSAPLQSFSIH